MIAAGLDESTDWARFLGQLHPVLLHLPIGAMAVLLLVECARPWTRGAGLRRALLVFTALVAVLAAGTGWLLGDSGEYAGATLQRHRNLGVALAALLSGIAVLELWGRGRRWVGVVRVVGLLAACGLVLVVGHLGGTMTHGKSFLSHGAPPWFRDALARLRVDASPDVAGAGAQSGASVFEVLQKHCVECHGPDKQKGKLRLDTREGLQSALEPGEHGSSELVRRLMLPPGHEDAMPPEGEMPAEAIVMLLRWVHAGAPLENVSEAQRTAATERQAAAQVLRDIEQATGARIAKLPDSDTLRIDFARSELPPTSETLAQLEPIAPRLAALSLAGQPLPAQRTVPHFPALRRLHLERSGVDDDTLPALLAATPAVEYLNLHSTAIGSRSLEAIAALPALRRLVLFDTALEDTELEAFRTTHRGVHVTAALQLSPSPAADGGRRILAADASKGHILLLREEAIGVYHELWKHPIRQIHDLQLLASGHVLFQDTWTRLVEVDPTTDEVVWSYDAATQNREVEGERVEVHAFQRLADGTTYLAESGPARILEIDRDGAVLHVVALQVEHPDPHHDTRLVRRTPAGSYLVAHEADGVVREYARDGSIVWSYAVPLFDRARAPGHGPDSWGNQLFSATRLPSGNTLIATGNGHAVLEVTPGKEIAWQLTEQDVPGIRLAWLTTVQVLHNGNIVLGNCHAGEKEPQIIEVTRDKVVAWTFRDFERFGNALSNSWVIE